MREYNLQRAIGSDREGIVTDWNVGVSSDDIGEGDAVDLANVLTSEHVIVAVLVPPPITISDLLELLQENVRGQGRIRVGITEGFHSHSNVGIDVCDLVVEISQLDSHRLVVGDQLEATKGILRGSWTASMFVIEGLASVVLAKSVEANQTLFSSTEDVGDLDIDVSSSAVGLLEDAT